MHHRHVTLIVLVGIVLGTGAYFAMPILLKSNYQEGGAVFPVVTDSPHPEAEYPNAQTESVAGGTTASPSGVVVTHVQTPEPLKAIYMSSWVAATPSIRSKLVSLIDTTELNAVVIDIKDSTGKVSFLTHDPALTALGSTENRISDIDAFLASLHEKGIYVIGRISVFQDPFMTAQKPQWAIKKKSDGTVWKDFKGLSFLDPSNDDVHAYIFALAKESYAHGFDEINFDYIRFPSDGKISDIAYPNTDGSTTRADIIKAFFAKLKQNLDGTGIVTSADLFGLVTTSPDDLGIGQVLENGLPYFDYIAPMVYPSHFGAGWNGYKNPAEHPYEVIKASMTRAVERAKAMGENPAKLRPWLQDFNLGATYTADMVRAQITATYDSELTSWMLWSAANTYTAGALKKE